jgi:hypothetical protein
MIEGKVGNPDVRWAALFAYAAGITSTLANLFLIAFFVLQANNPVEGASFGTANDLVGSLGTAFMIPVALALSAWLPDRTTTTITQIVGLSSMALLVVCGPLLVLGVIEFEVQALIAIGAWALLSLWLFLVNRWLRSSRDLPTRVAWFGELMGTLVLAAGRSPGSGCCCRGCRGSSWWCSASVGYLLWLACSAPPSGSCSWADTLRGYDRAGDVHIFTSSSWIGGQHAHSACDHRVHPILLRRFRVGRRCGSHAVLRVRSQGPADRWWH